MSQRVVPNCVQLFSCDKCGMSDSVEYLADEDAAQVMQDVRELHESLHPDCPGDLRFTTRAFAD